MNELLKPYLKEIFPIVENDIHMTLAVDLQDNLKLLHFSAAEFHEEDIVLSAIPEGFPFLGLELAGFDRPYERHGVKYIVTAPGHRMKFVDLKDERNELGRVLVITTRDALTDVYVLSTLQFFDGLSIMRITHRIENRGTDMQTLTYISSFHYEGIEKEGLKTRDEKMKVYLPHNSWQREMNWKCHTLPELGMEQVQPSAIQRSSGHIHISNTGNWSSKEYLPMSFLENEETHTSLFWQIEHNGSWHWEIGDQNGHLYLALGGPNEHYSHWFRNLQPGDVFETVPASIGVTAGGFDEAMGVLTDYRRIIRRKNADNENLPVIFNDYMNCLWANPTTAEEFPLIEAAQKAGCEYFVIDAGWYADGDWWDSVGEWKESKVRFPNGVREVTDAIRAHGMIPGVWLEPEVMGIHCELANQVPDDWFFVRHGKRIFDRSRYQLDYRNPEVIKHMDAIVDRLVTEYGVGYFKFDYNIEPGIGTELYADSAGDGMLGHERAYLAWLDGLWKRYPDLIIENCSSGGLRIDYAMLSKCSIQSTSDQDDYLRYATISANAPSAVTPEQSAIWAYPMNHDSDAIPADTSAAHLGSVIDPAQLREETIFNMVNAMLQRIHQSGHLAKLDSERSALVAEALQAYKEIRSDIKISRPFWPLGLSSYTDPWVCLGLKTADCAYLAIWKRSESVPTCEIPLNRLAQEHPINKLNQKQPFNKLNQEQPQMKITYVYPKESSITYTYQEAEQKLVVTGSQPISACVLKISFLKASDE